MVVPVGFVDTAKADIRAYIADPHERVALVKGIMQVLAAFPARHRRCPPEMRFGPDARFYFQSGCTVVFDLLEGREPGGDASQREVWIRHVWPATGMKAAGLFL